MLTLDLKKRLEKVVDEMLLTLPKIYKEKGANLTVDSIERVMRQSILKRNKEALEYSISLMRQKFV